MAARSFWRVVALAGAFGAAAFLARSFVSPAAPPEPAPPAPRKRAARQTHRGDDARRNGHGRAH